ncbi:MAG: BspA family leucine-rich repeat surface protein [Cellulophaga sp.]
MKHYFRILTLLLLVVFIGCNKDEDTPKNLAPIIKSQSHNASEAISPETIIGKVVATDPEGETLTYSITANSANLFMISTTGNLSLVAGTSLDYETATTHDLTVQVSDGDLSATAQITINVTDVDEVPNIAAQTFTIAEDLAANGTIGIVVATDPNNDAITYSLTNETNASTTFIMDGNLIKLATGQLLDHETASSFDVTVIVSDGTLTASASIYIIVEDVNDAPPVIVASGPFTVAEDIASNTFIGTVSATDADSSYTFSLTDDAHGLFRIGTNNGDIYLTAGNNLDYETVTQHTVEVQVTDGVSNTTATVTINVTDVNDGTPTTGTAFITTWKTTTVNGTITIPTNNAFTYDYSVDWGDGKTSANKTGNAIHLYGTPGTYTVKITGTFPAIYFTNQGDREKIKTIEQWGANVWESMELAFFGCYNLTNNATDVPDLSGVTSMIGTFRNASAFNANLNGWNVSNVTNMFTLFNGATSFNGDISSWNVGNVTNMGYMFSSASAFNQNIGGWDVSKVITMTTMFANATVFNQNLNNWDVSSVRKIDRMFNYASAFNGDISSWNVGDVRDMNQTFSFATNFNVNIGNWDVSRVTDMTNMFYEAPVFNQDVSSWNVGKVVSMPGMFRTAAAFSQNLANWDTSKVTSCSGFETGSALTLVQLPQQGSCFISQ